MKRTSVILFAILGTLTLSGCPSPTVKYITNPTEDFDGHIKFRVIDSRILIAKAQENKTTGITQIETSDSTQPLSDISATVVQMEDESALYAVVPKSTWLWLVRTNLSATFQDNTRLVKQLGVTVEDNRLKAIQAAGSIATAIVTGGTGAEPKPPAIKVPVIINPYADLKNDWEPLDIDLEYKVIFNSQKDRPEDVDAVAIGKFFTEFRGNGWFNSTSVFPISSCRNIILKVRPTLEHAASLENPRNVAEKENEDDYKARLSRVIQDNIKPLIEELKLKNVKAEGEGEDKYNKRLTAMALTMYDPRKTRTFALQIADPRFVRTIRMPDKGSISTHSVCGADTKTEGTQITGYQDLLGELGKQAKAVYDVQKAKAAAAATTAK